MEKFIIIILIATISLLIFTLFISKYTKKRMTKYLPLFILVGFCILLFLFIQMVGFGDALRDLGYIVLIMINFIASVLTLFIVGIIDLIKFLKLKKVR